MMLRNGTRAVSDGNIFTPAGCGTLTDSAVGAEREVMGDDQRKR